MRIFDIGIIDGDRMANIPPKYRVRHEFCFYLHDTMLSLLMDLAKTQYPSTSFKLETEEDIKLFHESGDPISYFIKKGQHDLARHLTVSQAMMAVMADFFNFVFEGLKALEKRKFIVSLAFLRKPLKENLLYLTIMLASDEDFFQGLLNSPASSFGHPGVQDTHRKKYFRDACKILETQFPFDPEFLHNLIYDLSMDAGFAPPPCLTRRLTL